MPMATAPAGYGYRWGLSAWRGLVWDRSPKKQGSQIEGVYDWLGPTGLPSPPRGEGAGSSTQNFCDHRILRPRLRGRNYFKTASWNSFQSSRLFRFTASRGALVSSGSALAERMDLRVSSSWM